MAPRIPANWRELPRVCSRCKVEQPIENYYVQRVKKCGGIERPSSRCKTCHAEFSAVQFRTAPPSREYERARTLKRWGMTPEDERALLARQGGVCAICRQPQRPRARDGLVRWFSLDHNHATGQVRGLLCDTCNAMLGYARDNPEILESGAEYLRAYAAEGKCRAS